jgi:hypothetical protein
MTYPSQTGLIPKFVPIDGEPKETKILLRPQAMRVTAGAAKAIRAIQTI